MWILQTPLCWYFLTNFMHMLLISSSKIKTNCRQGDDDEDEEGEGGLGEMKDWSKPPVFLMVISKLNRHAEDSHSPRLRLPRIQVGFKLVFKLVSSWCSSVCVTHGILNSRTIFQSSTSSWRACWTWRAIPTPRRLGRGRSHVQAMKNWDCPRILRSYKASGHTFGDVMALWTYSRGFTIKEGI